jgi:hypothetical protein
VAILRGSPPNFIAPHQADPPMSPDPDFASEPVWSRVLSMLHPVQIAVVEAFDWIDEPISATLLFDVFGRDVRLGTVAYHLRRLADAGVLVWRYDEPRRGTHEHFYALVS